MKITWLTTWSEISDAQFRNDWTALLNNAENSHVFFTPELCDAWLETYRPLRNLQPRFLLISDGSSTLLWPLVRWRQNVKNLFRSCLIPVGFSDYDYAEPIVTGNRDGLIAAALQELKAVKDCDAIRIKGLIDPGADLEMESQICPICRLSDYSDGEDFLQKVKKSLREDIRRQRNRVEKLGSLNFEQCSRDKALTLLPEFLENHKMRWTNAYKAPRFHENLIRFGVEKNLVCFDILKSDDHLMAWHMGFHYNRCFYYYMPAAQMEFQQYSPGKLLLYYLLERSIKSNDLIFDHLRGNENYKAGWTNEIRNLWQFNTDQLQWGSMLRNKFCDTLKPGLKGFL